MSHLHHLQILHGQLQAQAAVVDSVMPLQLVMPWTRPWADRRHQSAQDDTILPAGAEVQHFLPNPR